MRRTCIFGTTSKEYSTDSSNNPITKGENLMGDEEQTIVYDFTIRVFKQNEARMKNISLASLPNFHGMAYEDPDTFLFDFEVVSNTYDYAINSQKLKLFSFTFKYVALMWFMSLEENNITTWN